MFEPIRTPRLLIRPVVPDDLEPLLARRNDPVVAEHQNWTLPFPRERAAALVAEVAAMDGPANDEWWMATVCLPSSGEVLGDVAVHLTWEGRTAELGYTFASEHWGLGYAAEAVQAMIEWLFADPARTRICGMTHPANRASAMVLERNGLRYEGRTRSSYWVGEECSDDCLFGMTRTDWEAWRKRPRDSPDDVGLVEIDASNAGDVLRVETQWWQRDFVAPVVDSFADALVPETVGGAPVVPWMRAVVADGTIVGFTMLALVTDHHPEPFLWRLTIDRHHQRRGIGRRVLDRLVAELEASGHRTLLVSWVDGKGSPRPFYERYGFVPTGEIVDGEIEARLRLDATGAAPA